MAPIIPRSSCEEKLGSVRHHERQLFLESLWWFLHRVSGFGVTIENETGFHAMKESLDESLCPSECSQDMVSSDISM
jgi:hypothetical protein